MSQNPTLPDRPPIDPERPILNETNTICVFVPADKREAMQTLHTLATWGIPTVIFQTTTKAWHIAVPAALATDVILWLATFRPNTATNPCGGDPTMKHPYEAKL